MAVTQIYNLVNKLAKEALGAEAITVKDTTSFVSLGAKVLATDETRDAFYAKLPEQIARIYFKYKRYNSDYDKGMYKTPIEFGAAIQLVEVFKIAKAKSNKSWEDNPNPFANGKDDTDIVVQIMKDRGTFSIDKVIYDYQLNEAFQSEANFSAFVNLIFNDMYNAMELDLENLSMLCRAVGIASCINAASTHPTVSRNLLAEYKAKFTTSTLTADDCLYDTDFLKFASREINLTAKRMRRMSELFNSAGADRFTRKEDLVIDILADFATATASYLEADTFHKELVSLPMYNEIDRWQGSGTAYDFESTSNVNITAGDSEDGKFTVNQSGIIAFVRDVSKCGIMFDRIRTKSLYNPLGERTHYSHKADKGWYVDTTANGVVFYVADTESDEVV